MGLGWGNIDIGPAAWRWRPLHVPCHARNVEWRFRDPLAAGNQAKAPCAEAVPQINRSQMSRHHHHNAAARAQHALDFTCRSVIQDEGSRKGGDNDVGACVPQRQQPCVGADQPWSPWSSPSPLSRLPDHCVRTIHSDPAHAVMSGVRGEPPRAAAKLNNGSAGGNKCQCQALPVIPLTSEEDAREGIVDRWPPAIERFETCAKQGGSGCGCALPDAT